MASEQVLKIFNEKILTVGFESDAEEVIGTRLSEEDSLKASLTLYDSDTYYTCDAGA